MKRRWQWGGNDLGGGWHVTDRGGGSAYGLNAAGGPRTAALLRASVLVREDQTRTGTVPRQLMQRRFSTDIIVSMTQAVCVAGTRGGQASLVGVQKYGQGRTPSKGLSRFAEGHTQTELECTCTSVSCVTDIQNGRPPIDHKQSSSSRATCGWWTLNKPQDCRRVRHTITTVGRLRQTPVIRIPYPQRAAPFSCRISRTPTDRRYQ